MPFVLLSDESLDIQGLSLSGIKRSDASVDLRSKSAQFLDMRQQLLSDLFLIGFRQAGYFGNRQFKCFDHVSSYHIARR